MNKPYLNKTGFNKLALSIKDYINRKIVNLGADAVGTPVGTILPYGGAASPTGWLLCEGQEVLRSDYPELFSVIGTSFGAGDGATTFNLPDMRDRAAMGATTGHVLGAVEEDSMKSHTHTMTHTHSFTPAGTVSAHAHGLNNHTHSFTPAGTVSAHTHGLNNHTHSFTPAGTVSAHKHALSNTDSATNAADHTIFTGSAVTSGGASTNTVTIIDPGHSHTGHFGTSEGNRGSDYSNLPVGYTTTTGTAKTGITATHAHTHSVTAAGTVTGNTRATTPTFTGKAGTTGGSTANTADATPTFTGTVGTTGGSTANTANATPTFTGSAGTTGKATGSTANATPTFTGTAGNTGASSAADTDATGSTETKPKNVRVNYIIKAKLVA